VTFRPFAYRPKTKLVLPLRGRFLVYVGHDYYSHHRRIDLSNPLLKRLGLAANPVRYAYDFSPIDEAGSWCRGDSERPANWIGYGAPVYAPAAGVVVSVASDVPDNKIENGRPIKPQFRRNDASAILGNHVVIDHGNGEYSILAHMKADSIMRRVLIDRADLDAFVESRRRRDGRTVI
jgi:hypothetical protein